MKYRVQIKHPFKVGASYLARRYTKEPAWTASKALAASFPTKDAARKAWNRVKKDFPGALIASFPITIVAVE